VASLFFFLVLMAIACRRYSACNGRIINFEGGSDLFHPSPNGWAGPPPKRVSFVGPISVQSSWAQPS